MTEGFKYTLEPYKGMKSRYNCPNCRKKKTFVRYVDVDGNHVGDDVGRCNSEISCGYHKKPSDNEVVISRVEYVRPIPTPLNDDEVIGDYFKDSLYFYLIKHFDVKKVQQAFLHYHVRSTDVKWKNSTIFYQIDRELVFHTGKIIKYDWNTGKRVKKPFPKIYWIHKLLSRNFELEQCLFGEHLLTGLTKDDTVYLVESEKTAIICYLHNPNNTYIATGGLSNINFKKMSVLSGLDVIALPDKGGYELWKKKLEPFGIKVHSILENNNNINVGDDIADLIMR